MDLIIGLVAIVLVAYYIVKGYSATGVLMFGGLVLLLLSVLMGNSILPENVKSTGSTYLDIIEYVKYLLFRLNDHGVMRFLRLHDTLRRKRYGGETCFQTTQKCAFPLRFNDLCLLSRLLNVFCRVFCNRLRRIVDGDIVPRDGQRGYFSRRRSGNLRLTDFYHFIAYLR